MAAGSYTPELLAGLVAEALPAAGEVRLCVTGRSMLPSLWPGDVLTVRPQSAGKISAGDVILFRCRGRLLVHRVVGRIGSGAGESGRSEEAGETACATRVANAFGKLRKKLVPNGDDRRGRLSHYGESDLLSQGLSYQPTGLTFVTRGDGLLKADPPVLESDVLGRVVAVTRSGRCFEPARHPSPLVRLICCAVRRVWWAPGLLARLCAFWNRLEGRPGGRPRTRGSAQQFDNDLSVRRVEA